MTTEARIEALLADYGTEVRLSWWKTKDGEVIWSAGWERRRPYQTSTGKHRTRTQREWSEGPTLVAALAVLAGKVLR